jgi:hypothetical protein
MGPSILPFDLGEILHSELLRERRPEDFLAHASSHITGSLRHAQLDVAGAPRKTNPLLSEITLKTGTMWHEWLHDALRRLGLPYMAEVNLTPWLPPGWAGTADALFWHPEAKAFVLGDFKTQKGEGMRFIQRDGAKAEHVAQTSAYWHAARKMGLPLAKRIGVLYLPKNDTKNRDEVIEPLLVDFDPLPVKALHKDMGQRWGRVSEYVTSLGGEPGHPVQVTSLEGWVTDALEPVSQREQRIYFDRQLGVHEVKLVPHWANAYCRFPHELCDCSTQGTTKIGMYDHDGTYIPRKGYEDIEPVVEPS